LRSPAWPAAVIRDGAADFRTAVLWAITLFVGMRFAVVPLDEPPGLADRAGPAFFAPFLRIDGAAAEECFG